MNSPLGWWHDCMLNPHMLGILADLLTLNEPKCRIKILYLFVLKTYLHWRANRLVHIFSGCQNPQSQQKTQSDTIFGSAPRLASPLELYTCVTSRAASSKAGFNVYLHVSDNEENTSIPYHSRRFIHASDFPTQWLSGVAAKRRDFQR